MGEFLRTVVSLSGENTAKGTWLLLLLNFFFLSKRILNLCISEQQGLILRGTEAAPWHPGSGPKR